MASYAVSTHIIATRPHLRTGCAASTLPCDRTGAVSGEAVSSVVRLELLTDEDGGLDGWLEQLRVRWDQTTWYLFHAEGWL